MLVIIDVLEGGFVLSKVDNVTAEKQLAAFLAADSDGVTQHAAESKSSAVTVLGTLIP